jgi:predicted methyltransferase
VLFRNATNAQREEVAAKPELFGKPVFTVLEKGKYDIAPPGSADLVLTFRNLHNWMDAGDADEVFGAMYRALRPGGVLGFVEHRANRARKTRRTATCRGVHHQLAEKAGFSSSRNPRSTQTPGHEGPPEGRLDPPPSKLKDTDREKYAAIGESDRMTLKFVKP